MGFESQSVGAIPSGVGVLTGSREEARYVHCTRIIACAVSKTSVCLFFLCLRTQAEARARLHTRGALCQRQNNLIRFVKRDNSPVTCSEECGGTVGSGDGQNSKKFNFSHINVMIFIAIEKAIERLPFSNDKTFIIC